jgi:hypothetical protein
MNVMDMFPKHVSTAGGCAVDPLVCGRPDIEVKELFAETTAILAHVVLRDVVEAEEKAASEERETGERIDEKAVARYDLRDPLQAFHQSHVPTLRRLAGEVRAGEDLPKTIAHSISDTGQRGLTVGVTKHEFCARMGKADYGRRDSRNDICELREADGTPLEIEFLVTFKKPAATDARRREGHDGFDIRGKIEGCPDGESGAEGMPCEHDWPDGRGAQPIGDKRAESRPGVIETPVAGGSAGPAHIRIDHIFGAA